MTRIQRKRKQRVNDAIVWIKVISSVLLMIFLCTLYALINISDPNNHNLRHLPKKHPGVLLQMPLDEILVDADETEEESNIKVDGTEEKPLLSNNITPSASGFIILGMHRSGTSLLAGLLTLGSKYNVGDNLMQNKPDNPKGFFERWDTYTQNEKWMGDQDMGWETDNNLLSFDWKKALKFDNPWDYVKNKNIVFSYEKNKSHKYIDHTGVRTLEFLTNPQNSPWMMKEPRLCVTLPAWINLLENSPTPQKPPAILFTYRHPVEVAESIHKRERKYDIEKGLKLWLIYNRRALENSSKLCRVYAHNKDIIEHPLEEVKRITNELTTKCGVPNAPKEIEQSDVNLFFDDQLQHYKEEKSTSFGLSCFQEEFEKANSNIKKSGILKPVLKVFCDLKSGEAFKVDYQWPDL